MNDNRDGTATKEEIVVTLTDRECFERHPYTVNELQGLPLSPWIVRIFLSGFVFCFIVAVITMPGGFLGMWIGGQLGFGVAIIPFFALSAFLGNKAMGVLEPEDHIMLNRRRVGSMVLGVFFGALPGLAAGIFGSQAIGNAAGWNQQGYDSGDIIMLLLFATIAALAAATVGLVTVVAQESSNKKEVLNAFSEWQSEAARKGSGA